MPRSAAATRYQPSASDQPGAERMVRLATQLATQAMPLARMALGRMRAGSGARPDAVEAEIEAAPPTGFARTAASVARAVNAVGATIYDYSNGQYGIKPVDMKELRRARQAAEKEAERHQQRQARGKGRQPTRTPSQAPGGAADAPAARGGGAKWVLIGLGALAVGGAVAAVVILQREQLRAAATQALDRGRQTMEQTRRQLKQVSTFGDD